MAMFTAFFPYALALPSRVHVTPPQTLVDDNLNLKQKKGLKLYQIKVVRHLIGYEHVVHVVTGAPDFIFTSEIQSPNLHIRKDVLDCGAVQADALTVDRLASLEKYSETAVVPRDSILAAEVQWLNSIKVSDVVPVACRAVADAGIRSVCITNFSWDFIYAEYVMEAGIHHRSIVWQVNVDFELQRLRIEVRHLQRMYEVAYEESLDTSYKVWREKCWEEFRAIVACGAA